MWFIFPQLRGLGNSFYSELYGLNGLDDARAYLAHPTLGGRLRKCVEMTLGLKHQTPHLVFDTPDDLKFHACLTLFDAALPGDVFHRGLLKFFGGAPHRKTLEMLKDDKVTFKSILRRIFR